MLQQFTWGQFLLASFVLSFLWYVFVVLVFYRREFIGLLSGSSGTAEPLPHRWEKGVEVLDREVGNDSDLEESLMGKPALPQGMALVKTSDVAFAAADTKNDQVGMVADVIQDLKEIFKVLEEQAGNKKDFFRLLEKVKGDYGRIGGHPSIGNINRFISEHAPFHLSTQELENLWY
ncbi:MAG: hypothetical protein EOO88_25825 [Pedobacter sp.]|nr:MAG: hypothetical protein EOO88_25825 [Pedobacter sp.]